MTIWQTAELGKIASIDRSSLAPEKIESGTLYLGLEHIAAGGQIRDVQTVGNGDLKSSKFQFSSSHLLYGKLRPYLAKIALPDFHGICSTDIIPILPGPSLDRRYLLYFLRQDPMVDYANSRASGANLPRLSPKELAKFQIPLPPLPEQKRIAAILDAADALRAKRRESLDQLDVLLQSTFLDMFGDPVTNPMGWQLVPLSSIAELENGDRSSNYPSGLDVLDSGVLFLSTKNISNNQLIFDKCQFISKEKFNTLNRGKLRRNDLVITLRGTLGSCAIFDCEFDTGFINAQILIIHPSKTINHKFLHAFLTTDRMRNHFIELSTGVAVKQLTAQQIGNLSVVFPSLDLQNHFATIAQSIETQKTRLRAHLAELDTLFASLQSRAFNGEL